MRFTADMPAIFSRLGFLKFDPRLRYAVAQLLFVFNLMAPIRLGWDNRVDRRLRSIAQDLTGFHASV